MFHQRISSFLQSIDATTSRVGAALVVAFLMFAFVIVLAFAGFPPNWQVTFSTMSNAIVIVMLFVLKHTEARQQTALQLKLDELIRSSPAADDHLVQIERAEEEELASREQEQIEVHESLRNEGGQEPADGARS
jgi:low affinity Fe/Cu permease